MNSMEKLEDFEKNLAEDPELFKNLVSVICLSPMTFFTDFSKQFLSQPSFNSLTGSLNDL